MTAKQKIKDTVIGTAIGFKKMVVTLWCVTGIVAVVWLVFDYTKINHDGSVNIPIPEYIIVMAIVAITALGGVNIMNSGFLKR